MICIIVITIKVPGHSVSKYCREVKEIATKSYKDLTPQQKAKRLAYAKAYRKKIAAAARAAGVIGAPRPKMSDAERKTKRKAYAKAYRQRIVAEAKAYRRLQGK